MQSVLSLLVKGQTGLANNFAKHLAKLLASVKCLVFLLTGYIQIRTLYNKLFYQQIRNILKVFFNPDWFFNTIKQRHLATTS